MNCRDDAVRKRMPPLHHHCCYWVRVGCFHCHDHHCHLLEQPEAFPNVNIFCCPRQWSMISIDGKRPSQFHIPWCPCNAIIGSFSAWWMNSDMPLSLVIAQVLRHKSRSPAFGHCLPPNECDLYDGQICLSLCFIMIHTVEMRLHLWAFWLNIGGLWTQWGWMSLASF